MRVGRGRRWGGVDLAALIDSGPTSTSDRHGRRSLTVRLVQSRRQHAPVRQADEGVVPHLGAQHARRALHRLAQHVAHGGEPECRPITGLWTWRWHTPCHDPLACHYWVFGHTRGICRSWVSTNRSPCREDGRPGVLVSHTVIPGGRWTTRGRRPGGPPKRRRPLRAASPPPAQRSGPAHGASSGSRNTSHRRRLQHQTQQIPLGSNPKTGTEHGSPCRQHARLSAGTRHWPFDSAEIIGLSD